jgi:asparagine synthase (glutamine-hydrolysing)
MTEAVRLRMRSDVPLGAFLSGGVDSTIVAGLMQSLSDQPVKTFCIGFPVREFDEREFARIAARHLKTEHHELVIEPSGLDILPKLIWHFDEPFADSSAIPTLYLSEMTREHVTVSLSGDGGDELFGGYDRYKAVEWGMAFDRWPGFLRAMVTSPVWQWLPTSSKQKSKRRRLKRLLEALGDEPRRRYLRWVSIFDDKRRAQLYSRDFLERLGDHDSAWFLLDAYRRAAGSDFVSQTMFADVETYLPCDILTKVDIASMAYALEVRCPFLDHEVVEFAARLPIEQKRRGGIGKRILRETFADLLPTAVTNRGKMGFGVPLAYWFRDELSDLIRGALLDRRSLDRGYFEPDQVRKLVEEHASGRWDHSYRLWSLLVLELWHRMYIDHDPPREAPAVKPRVPENAAVSGAT